MKSVTTEKFRKAMSKLPADVQQRARQAYKLWKQNNNHPSLHFKQVHDKEPIYSVRIGLSYRALGVKKDDTIIWSGLAPMKSTIIWSLIYDCKFRLTNVMEMPVGDWLFIYTRSHRHTDSSKLVYHLLKDYEERGLRAYLRQSGG